MTTFHRVTGYTMECSEAAREKNASATVGDLAARLRNGPLTSLMALQQRAEAVAAQRSNAGKLSDDELIESLETFVHLAQSAMIGFHEFTADLQALVDRLIVTQADSARRKIA